MSLPARDTHNSNNVTHPLTFTKPNNLSIDTLYLVHHFVFLHKIPSFSPEHSQVQNQTFKYYRQSIPWFQPVQSKFNCPCLFPFTFTFSQIQFATCLPASPPLYSTHFPHRQNQHVHMHTSTCILHTSSTAINQLENNADRIHRSSEIHISITTCSSLTLFLQACTHYIQTTFIELQRPSIHM